MRLYRSTVYQIFSQMWNLRFESSVNPEGSKTQDGRGQTVISLRVV